MENENCFRKEGDVYVFSCGAKRRSIEKILRLIFVDELKSITEDYDVMNPNIYFVIGSCYPKDNKFLLYQKNGSKIAAYIKRIIEKNPSLKYYLKECDIKLDISMFNDIFDDLFNSFLGNISQITKNFGDERRIVFIKNSNLDCYMIYRFIRDEFGKVNTINLHKKFGDKMSDNIISLNDVIDSGTMAKKELCRTKDFDFYRFEICETVRNSLQDCGNG